MPRFKLTIEYDGGPFVGFQRQATGPSVQGAVEAAIKKFCGETVTVFGAGRTDAGVHAQGQVIHFDLERAQTADTVRDALNFHLLPDPVAVLVCEEAPDFHARFDAKARHYEYRIVNRRAPLTMEKGLAWHVVSPLDAPAMHEAAQLLIGTHDFTTFRASRCQSKTPVKTLDLLNVSRVGETIAVRAEARSFLHHQVRSMVGSLKLVGEGKWSADDLEAALEARDRKALGLNAPAHGLTLVRVLY